MLKATSTPHPNMPVSPATYLFMWNMRKDFYVQAICQKACCEKTPRVTKSTTTSGVMQEDQNLSLPARLPSSRYFPNYNHSFCSCSRLIRVVYGLINHMEIVFSSSWNSNMLARYWLFLHRVLKAWIVKSYGLTYLFISWYTEILFYTLPNRSPHYCGLITFFS